MIYKELQIKNKIFFTVDKGLSLTHPNFVLELKIKKLWTLH